MPVESSRNMRQTSSLATFSIDNLHIQPLLCIIGTEGQLADMISLNMHTLNLMYIFRHRKIVFCFCYAIDRRCLCGLIMPAEACIQFCRLEVGIICENRK